MSGTEIPSAGYPTGIRRKALSFSGLCNMDAKKFIGLGVCVKAAMPNLCKAVNKIPTEIPTDSFT